MRKPRVYIDAELVSGQSIALDKTRGHYLKNVLRLKPGAAFFLFNGHDSNDYQATLVADGKQLSAEIGAARPLATESALGSEIVQGLARADHIDWTIQKTTELGVSTISLFNAERSQSPLKAAQLDKKLAHWRGVAISACEQCGRAMVPQIRFHPGLEQALRDLPDSLKLLLDFEGRPLASALQPGHSRVSILLGPEGGLNPQEIGLAKDAGFQPVSLGSRVLRTETAATAALAIIQSGLGDLGP
ncbi:MAG: 16S rRNA (uracil(1498)-N(3))-methyltransferase [Gammaproteobacteria bacterium]|nr:16S rRNA (uracil(1498)-N(3))-methyltransferase [Gammaproteobacteria bacterium]